MDDDMIARRAERLTPAGRECLAEMREAMEAGDQDAIPGIVSRIRELPAAGQEEIMGLVALLGHATSQEASRIDAAAKDAEEAGRVILAAQAKLRAEGKPADTNMSVGEAYKILDR